MAITKANIQTFGPSSVVIDGVDFGAISVDGIELTSEVELLPVEAGQSIATYKHIINKRSDTLSFTAIEVTLAKLAMLYNPDTAVSSTVFTADEERAISAHTLAVTLTLSGGDSWVIEGDVEFDPNMTLPMKINELGSLPMKAMFLPDTDNDNLMYTITRTPSAVTALTVDTFSPADGATAVTVTDNLTWTFSRGIQSGSVSTQNFKVIDTVTGAAVAGAISYNSSTFVVTFNPTASLGAAQTYNTLVDARVNPLVGARMAADAYTNFDTA